MCHVYPSHPPTHVPLHTPVEQQYINRQRHIWLREDNPCTRMTLQPPTSRNVNTALGQKRDKTHHKLGSGTSIRRFWSVCQVRYHNLFTINPWKTKFISLWQSCFVPLGVKGPQPWGVHDKTRERERAACKTCSKCERKVTGWQRVTSLQWDVKHLLFKSS